MRQKIIRRGEGQKLFWRRFVFFLEKRERRPSSEAREREPPRVTGTARGKKAIRRKQSKEGNSRPQKRHKESAPRRGTAVANGHKHETKRGHDSEKTTGARQEDEGEGQGSHQRRDGNRNPEPDAKTWQQG